MSIMRFITSWRLAITPRTSKHRGKILMGATCMSAGLALLVGSTLLALLGHSPVDVMHAFFWQPFTSVYSAVEVLNKTTTLALIAIGLSAGFRAGVWNIGAEGQFIAGAVGGGAIGLALDGNTSLPVLSLMFIGGIVCGMLWASIPALLRTHLHVNEILTSLMLVYVAQLMLSYFVHGPLKNPAGFGFPQTKLFSDEATLPQLMEGARLYPTVLLLPLIVLVTYFLFKHSYIGFQMRVAGMAPMAARFSGYSESRAVWISFAVSGGLAGLMGVCEAAGPIGQLTPIISPGYGFTAIIVAFLGQLHPVGIVPAAALMALIYIGGENAQIAFGLPTSISGVFQGLVLFSLLASEFLTRYRITFKSLRAN